MNDRLRDAIKAAAEEIVSVDVPPHAIRGFLRATIGDHVEPVFADIQRENAELRALLEEFRYDQYGTCLTCPGGELTGHDASCRLAEAIAPREGEDVK